MIKKKSKKKAVKKKVSKRKPVKKKVTREKSPISKKRPKKPASKFPIKKLIKIKKKLSKASTGISLFDKMVQGGYERNSINIVAGGSGSGKSIFALQFLIQGMKKGEKTLYVTFEEKKTEFYTNMKKLGWDLAKLEKEGKFIFLEYSPEKVKMMLDEGGGSIESIILKHGTKRIVIDSITSFSLLFDDELSKRQAILGLFDIIRKWDVTSMLTVQYDPADKTDDRLAEIEFEVDSVVLLYYVGIKSRRERFIEVFKMRGANHSKDLRKFMIKKGIKIGKKTDIKKIS